MSIQNPVELLTEEIFKRERELLLCKKQLLAEQENAALLSRGDMFLYAHALETLIKDFCEEI